MNIGYRSDIHATVASITIDHDGIVISCDPVTENLFGYSQDEIVGANVSMLMPEPFRSEHDGYLSRYLKQGNPRIIGKGREVIGQRQDGTLFPMWLAVSQVVIGATQVFVGSIVDLSDTRKMEEQLQLSLETNRAILETAASPIITIDHRGGICSFNPAAVKLFGYSVDEVISHNISMLMPEPYRSQHDAYMARYLGSGNPHIIGSGREVRGCRKDGSTFPMHLSVGEMLLVGQKRFVGIITDITLQKENEHELERHRDRLDELVQIRTADLTLAMESAQTADRAKTLFLGNMSHELRTPLHQIVGVATLLKREALSAKGHERLGMLYTSVMRLDTVIGGILELVQLESGAGQVSYYPMDIRALLQEIVEMVTPDAHKKGLQLALEIGSTLPESLKGDQNHLKTIFACYLNNAIRFSEKGTITCRLTPGDRDKNGLMVRFEVQDEGPGIASEMVNKLFEPFEQADNSHTRRFGGTGIGLALVRKLARLMSGTAGCETELGKGSTFWATARMLEPDSDLSSTQLDYQI